MRVVRRWVGGCRRGEGRETERRADIHARVHIIERQRGMELERWQGIRGSRGKGRERRKTRRKESRGRKREKAQNEKDEKELEADGGCGGVELAHKRAREGGVPLIPRYNAHITFPSS